MHNSTKTLNQLFIILNNIYSIELKIQTWKDLTFLFVLPILSQILQSFTEGISFVYPSDII